MGTTDKTAAARQKRLRERKAQALAEYQAQQAGIDALIEDSKLTDAERWQLFINKVIERTKGR